MTMQPVPFGNTFLVALYCAADGVTDEAAFVQMGPAGGFNAPGYFNHGTRTSTPAIPPGGWGMFQVRIFESAYGSSYEQVWASGRGLLGKSAIVRVKTGNPQTVPPGTPGNLPNALAPEGPIYVSPWGEVTTVRVADATVVEGNEGFTELQFTVSISFPISLPLSVNFATTSGTATADVDYISTNGTLTFTGVPPFSQVITVPVRGDTDIEPDETVNLILSNPVRCVIGRGVATGTIRNDDCRTTVAFAWYPGVTIEGCVGKTYRIEVAEVAPGPYTAITNLVLPTSPYLWLDTVSPLGQQRFYRTFLVPSGP